MGTKGLCRFCSQPLRPDDRICPACGRSVTPEVLKPLRERAPHIAAILGVGLLLSSSCAYFVGRAVERQRAQKQLKKQWDAATLQRRRQVDKAFREGLEKGKAAPPPKTVYVERRVVLSGTMPLAQSANWEYETDDLWVGDFTIHKSGRSLIDEKWEHDLSVNARNKTERVLPVQVVVILYDHRGVPVTAAALTNVELGRTNELAAREARTLKAEVVASPASLASATQVLLKVVRP